MSVFGIFMICYCAGLIIMPAASVLSESDVKLFEKKEKPAVEKSVKKNTEQKAAVPKKEKKQKPPKIEPNIEQKLEPKIEPLEDTSFFGTVETVVFDDLTGRIIFSVEGDISKTQIVDHEGKTYIIYFDHVEKNKIYMGAQQIKK